MPKYSHTLSLHFSVVSDDPDGADLTPTILRAAIMDRMAALDRSIHMHPPLGEWDEGVLPPDETTEIGGIEPAVGLYVRDRALNLYKIIDERPGPLAPEYRVECLKGPNAGETLWVHRSAIIDGKFAVSTS